MTFGSTKYIILVVQKRGEVMGTKKIGRPTNSPKDYRLQIRVSEETLRTLDECVEALGKSRSAIVRNGIDLVKRSITKEK